MGYLKNSIKGATWIGALRGFIRMITTVRIVILARILSPSQIGSFGIAALVLALVEVLTETGINVVLLQERGSIRKYLDTAWVISILRGGIIAMVIFLSAPFISIFFNISEAYNLLALVSVVPLVRGFINPSIITLQKELRFEKEFLLRSSIVLVESVTAILLVFFMESPEGIVFGLIAGAIFEVVISFIFIKPTPNFNLKSKIFKEIFGRGKWITAFGVFDYSYRNIDNIAVGKILSAASLGLYDMAYKISILPITEVADVVTKVLLPVYVKISHDSKRLKAAFIKTISMVFIISLILGIIFFIFSKEIILLLLGEQWIDAVPVLKVLAVSGIIRAASGTPMVLFLSIKRQKYVTIITAASMLGIGISIVPLILLYGIVGAGIASLIGAVLALPFIFYFTLKTFKTLDG